MVAGLYTSGIAHQRSDATLPYKSAIINAGSRRAHAPRGMLRLFREAAREWSRHNAPRLGAALAYYTVLSLAPAVLFVVAISAFAFGEQAVEGQVYRQIRQFTGDTAAAAVQMLLRAAHRPAAGALATVLGLSTLLLGASGVFMELRETLNYIWGVELEETSGLWRIIRARLFSFAMVVGIGLLLMASLVMSTVIQAAGSIVDSLMPAPPVVLESANFLLSFAVTSFLFALIYKVIPEVPIAWQDVVIGSVTTAGLFSAGKSMIALYLGKASVGSAYGAAGSVVVLLVWVYYSSQIFLFGAEFTHVYAQRRARRDKKTSTIGGGIHPVMIQGRGK